MSQFDDMYKTAARGALTSFFGRAVVYIAAGSEPARKEWIYRRDLTTEDVGRRNEEVETVEVKIPVGEAEPKVGDVIELIDEADKPRIVFRQVTTRTQSFIVCEWTTRRVRGAGASIR